MIDQLPLSIRDAVQSHEEAARDFGTAAVTTAGPMQLGRAFEKMQAARRELLREIAGAMGGASEGAAPVRPCPALSGATLGGAIPSEGGNLLAMVGGGSPDDHGEQGENLAQDDGTDVDSGLARFYASLNRSDCAAMGGATERVIAHRWTGIRYTIREGRVRAAGAVGSPSPARLGGGAS